MHNLIRSIIVFLLIQYFGGNALAQSDTISQADRIGAGRLALQFGVSSNLTLSTFQGALACVQYHISSNKAVRLGLDGYLSQSSRNNSSEYSSGVSSGDDGSDNITLNLRTAYISYISPTSEILGFWGIGPVLGYSHSNIRELSTGTSSISALSRRGHTWSAGVQGILGSEWFFTSNLSLHAEYGFSVIYGWSTSTQISSYTVGSLGVFNESTMRETSDGWSVYGNSIRLGLSIYL